jgi:hypothetical protein
MIKRLGATVTPTRLIEKRSSQQGMNFAIMAGIQQPLPYPRPLSDLPRKRGREEWEG